MFKVKTVKATETSVENLLSEMQEEGYVLKTMTPRLSAKQMSQWREELAVLEYLCVFERIADFKSSRYLEPTSLGYSGRY